MKSVIVLLASLMFLSGCKFQQDPIAGAPEAVRQGRPPIATKPTTEKPLPKELLQVDAPASVVGRVEQAMEFKILGRVMEPGLPFRILINNLKDFPGATFNAQTGEFKWTPTRDLVRGRPSMTAELSVTVSTEPTAAHPVIAAETEKIVIVVLSSYTKPIVNSVVGPKSVATGSVYQYNFVIEDVDALSEGDISVVVRECKVAYYSDSIGHLVEFGRIFPVANKPGKFEGTAKLNLIGANLPADDYCFGIMAVSKFGVVSDLYETSMDVTTTPKNTRLTMEVTPELKVGEKIQIAFAIYDPSGVGSLVLKSMDDIGTILPGSTLACNRSYASKYKLDCRGFIDATTAIPRIYTITMAVENSHNYGPKVMTNHSLNIHVKAATP